MKKINGPLADQLDEKTGLKHYERIDYYTGDIVEVSPEYSCMSRGGRTGRGIGHDWISRYKLDCYPKDFSTIRGIRMRPPKYYDKYLEAFDPEMFDEIKSGRQLLISKLQAENSELRLSQQEKVKVAQFNQLKRSL